MSHIQNPSLPSQLSILVPAITMYLTSAVSNALHLICSTVIRRQRNGAKLPSIRLAWNPFFCRTCRNPPLSQEFCSSHGTSFHQRAFLDNHRQCTPLAGPDRNWPVWRQERKRSCVGKSARGLDVNVADFREVIGHWAWMSRVFVDESLEQGWVLLAPTNPWKRDGYGSGRCY